MTDPVAGGKGSAMMKDYKLRGGRGKRERERERSVILTVVILKIFSALILIQKGIVFR